MKRDWKIFLDGMWSVFDFDGARTYQKYQKLLGARDYEYECESDFEALQEDWYWLCLDGQTIQQDFANAFAKTVKEINERQRASRRQRIASANVE